MENPIVKTDKRELKSGITRYLKNFGCIVEEEQLEIGDYILSDRTAIERKSFSDLISSIQDLRLFSQLKHLCKFEKPILLVEGFEYFGNLNNNSLFGALASIILDFGVPVIWTKDKRDSANFIYSAAKREQFKNNREIAIRIRKRSKNLEDEQKYLIAGLPSVSSVLAKRLLEKFKTPHKIFHAKKEKLIEVKGMGEKKAQRIIDVLETKVAD
ncbi:MAG: hypothetical protein DRP06_00295 [Candidatus Aenigmatarchaeota archaeon]|nr:MAG: hypothetical protein DRP06_00295 [Candidatus Aenigmarchaeota archaeon]